MGFYGLNRAALNGGVSGIVAGAALLFATGDLTTQGVRVVLPSAAIAVTSSAGADARLALLGQGALVGGSGLQASAARVVFGDGGFIAESGLTAVAGLLQLQTANIYVASSLGASYTDAWAASCTALQGSGTVTQNGEGHSDGLCLIYAAPMVVAGFAGNIDVMSGCDADANVKRNGSNEWLVDGFARVAMASSMSASPDKTALGYAQWESDSYCEVTSTKTHGAQAFIDCAWETYAVASTDAATAHCAGDMTALATATRFFDAAMDGVGEVVAWSTVTQFGFCEIVCGSTYSSEARLAILAESFIATESGASAEARLGILADAQAQSISGATAESLRMVLAFSLAEGGSALVADGRLGILAEASVIGDSGAGAVGIVFENGFADVMAGSSIMTANGGHMHYSSTGVSVASVCAAFALVNVGAPDPDGRVMRRLTSTRGMRRSFTDRLMRRTA